MSVFVGAATWLVAGGVASAQNGTGQEPVQGLGTTQPAEPVGEPMTEPVPAPADPELPPPDPVPEQIDEPMGTTATTDATPYAISEQGTTRPMASIQLGGGVINFAEQGTRDRTNVGGSWDLRLGFAPWQYAGIELAYVGSAHDVNDVGFNEGSYLLGNGAEANLRFNLPIVLGNTTLAPFGFAGAGWTRYDLMDTDTFPGDLVVGEDDDHILTLPVGAGLSMAVASFYLDARFTYRPAFDDELFGDQDLDTWGFTAHVGSVF